MSQEQIREIETSQIFDIPVYDWVESEEEVDQLLKETKSK